MPCHCTNVNGTQLLRRELLGEPFLAAHDLLCILRFNAGLQLHCCEVVVHDNIQGHAAPWESCASGSSLEIRKCALLHACASCKQLQSELVTPYFGDQSETDRRKQTQEFCRPAQFCERPSESPARQLPRQDIQQLKLCRYEGALSRLLGPNTACQE